jgi:hypothetical protein
MCIDRDVEAPTECVVNDHPMHIGKCFCGAVEFSVTGKPELMGYCHCNSCRAWGAAPVNAFTLWRRDNVEITKGIDKIGSYRKTPQIERKWCTACGGHLLTDIYPLELVDVYAPLLPTLPFVPTIHVHYQETVLPMKDGIAKQRDFPKELGGSGTLVPE